MRVWILAVAAPLFGQTFEVASVRSANFPSTAFAAGFRAAKASSPCTIGDPVIAGTLVTMKGAGICDLIRYAYDVKGYQVLGVPKDLGFSGQDKPESLGMQRCIAAEDKESAIFYDIEARAPGSQPPTSDQVRGMVRALLAERFHLALHHETRDFVYYALVIAKNGPANLKPAADGCKPHAAPGLLTLCGQTMEGLARTLTARTDRTVLDKSGIGGQFDYEISYEMGDGDLNSAMLTSMQQTLKLKLEPAKGPLDVLVVDHVERPTAN